MPCTARSIRIVAKQNEAAGFPRRVAPFQGRGEIFAVAGKAAGIAAPSEKAVELSCMAFLPTPQALKRLPLLRPKWIDPGQRSAEAPERSCLQPRLRQLLNFQALPGRDLAQSLSARKGLTILHAAASAPKPRQRAIRRSRPLRRNAVRKARNPVRLGRHLEFVAAKDPTA